MLLILKLFIKFIIHQAETEINTQIREYIIHFCAFFIFSSSQDDIKYITQLKIRAKSATTATICINSAITLTTKSSQTFLSSTSPFVQPGNHSQTNLGPSAEYAKFVIKS
ncbi:MAG: hypothetical protein LBC61_07675 [Candidatus Peribacteria bacterium]|jgi:hypothetical protein|nr:hypothetical protein [Candidatus Peribacteria bacterium]